MIYDIRGDNKLVFMDWKEEVSDLFPEQDLLKKISEFRDENFNALDQIKSELQKDRLWLN